MFRMVKMAYNEKGCISRRILYPNSNIQLTQRLNLSLKLLLQTKCKNSHANLTFIHAKILKRVGKIRLSHANASATGIHAYVYLR